MESKGSGVTTAYRKTPLEDLPQNGPTIRCSRAGPGNPLDARRIELVVGRPMSRSRRHYAEIIMNPASNTYLEKADEHVEALQRQQSSGERRAHGLHAAARVQRCGQ